MLGNQWHKKERPLLSMLGLGGGAGGFKVGSGVTFDANTGRTTISCQI